MYVTIEEIIDKEIWVDADNFDDAVEIVEHEYKDGGIDVKNRAEVHALVGDAENEFVEIAVWYC